MTVSDKRIAESVLILKNILSGLFPVLTVIAYANDLPPLTTLAWSSLIATIFFIVLVTVRKEWKDNVANTKALKDILLSIFFIAVIYHFLFFLSLEFTSPQNVSLLGTMEIVFGFIILGLIFKREPVSRNHFIGAMLMFVSAGMILLQNKTAFNIGDLIILVAVAIAPIGNIFSKRALHQVSLSYLLFMRSLGAAIIFFIAAYMFEGIITTDILITSIP